MSQFEDRVAGLRKWVATRDRPHVRAAVELLIWHEGWLRRRDFALWAMQPGSEGIDWAMAREFLDEGEPRGSSSELAVLDLAVCLGQDRFGLSGLGLRHKRKAAEAFADACGWLLEGDMPEPGHSHPGFIPGTPETCGACAREAKDEGRR